MRISDWSSDVCSSDLPAPTRPAIDGSSAAAILLMLLDEEEAATILKHLGPDEVKGLAKAMYDTANATEGQIEQAPASFVARSRSVSAPEIGADPPIPPVTSQEIGRAARRGRGGPSG